MPACPFTTYSDEREASGTASSPSACAASAPGGARCSREGKCACGQYGASCDDSGGGDGCGGVDALACGPAGVRGDRGPPFRGDPSLPGAPYRQRPGGRSGGADVRDRAFRRRDSFDEDARSARPWLFGIATNVLRGELRSERRMLAAIARLDRSAESGWADEVERSLARADAASEVAPRSRRVRSRRSMRGHGRGCGCGGNTRSGGSARARWASVGEDGVFHDDGLFHAAGPTSALIAPAVARSGVRRKDRTCARFTTSR